MIIPYEPTYMFYGERELIAMLANEHEMKYARRPDYVRMTSEYYGRLRGQVETICPGVLPEKPSDSMVLSGLNVVIDNEVGEFPVVGNWASAIWPWSETRIGD